MRFTIETKVLKAALAVAHKSVNPKSPLPILSHLLLVATPQQVSITGHDLDMGVTITLEADVSETGGVTLPSAKLLELVGLAGTPTLELNKLGEGRIELVATSPEKSVRWEVSSLPEEEFPALPALDGRSVTLPASALGNAIEEAGIAAAKTADEARVIMTGVCVSAADGVLTCVSTDGRRMALAQRSVDFQGEVESVVVPFRVLAQVAKALGSDGNVRLYLANKHAFFEVGNKRWFSKILEGRFPDWTKVMPDRSEWPWVCRVNRKSLIDAVKGALAMAKEARSPDLLRLKFVEEALWVDSNTPDLGSARIKITAEGEGPDEFPEMGCNGSYLLDALNAIETENILWELQSDTRSSVVRPDDDISFRYVVMPVKLRDIAEEFEREAAAVRG